MCNKENSLPVSIVIPVYNEEENVLLLYEKLNEILRTLGKNYEIIFVDDGSTDLSPDILKEIFHKDDSVKLISFPRNFGKASAYSAGFKEAKGNIVITLDADLQDDPLEIPNFIEKIKEGYDLVVGWKMNRKDSFLKVISSQLFNKVISMLTGIKIHDFNSGFKAYRKDIIKNIKLYGELYRYIPVLANNSGYRITELKVKHHPRLAGKSKYGIEKYSRGFLDFLTVLFLTRYVTRPLHLFGSVGSLFTFLGFIINVYIALLKFTYGDIRGRTPLLMLGVLLIILGIQFISTGLMGEMIVSSQEKEIPFLNKKVLSHEDDTKS